MNMHETVLKVSSHTCFCLIKCAMINATLVREMGGSHFIAFKAFFLVIIPRIGRKYSNMQRCVREYTQKSWMELRGLKPARLQGLSL